MRKRTGLALAAAALVVLGACGADDSGSTGSTAPPEVATTAAPSTSDGAATTAPSAARTLAVPGDYGTIQAAVDAAQPGDLVLVSPGVYHEAVNVTTDEVTIRGLDRNDVILDGEFVLDNGIRVLGAKGVAVENMTARNYTVNGFFWTGVEGYRGSYLTAYRNGDYGIYAFDSTKGLLEHSYASGSPDAGFYIGQCYPCDAVVDDVVAEFNGLGYSGTNSGGNLLIVNSVFRNNRAGVVPNSGSYELCYPERDTTIVGNVVYSNNQPDTPAIDVAILAMGNGILLPGGVANLVEKNLVFDHDKTGIGLVPFLEQDPNDVPPGKDARERPCADSKQDAPPDPSSVPDSVLWEPIDNVVRGNVVRDSRVADLAVGSISAELPTFGNCFSGNDFATSAPANVEQLASCDAAAGAGDWTAGALDLGSWLTEQKPPSGDYKTTPVPAAQVNMPDAATAPARPATNLPPVIDLAAIQTPVGPPSL